MRVIKLALLVAAFSVSVSTASTAQAEDKVCFYEHTNYNGKSFCTSSDSARVPDNDTYSSIKFMDDTHYVEVYEHVNFEGRTIPIMDDVVRLRLMNDKISSIRMVPRTTGHHACLYQDTNYNGTPFGAYVLKYADDDSVTLKEVNTYRMWKAFCKDRDECDVPPEVSSPVPDFKYVRSIDYNWEYTGEEGSFKTTFVHHVGDAAGNDPVTFYQQESTVKQVDPASGRPVVIDEFANNVYNLAENPEPIHLWEYRLLDRRVNKPVVDDYVFGLAMMSIGSQLESGSDVSFGGILETGGSGGSGEDDPDNYFGDWLIDMLDRRSSGLGTTIAQVAPFGP